MRGCYLSAPEGYSNITLHFLSAPVQCQCNFGCWIIMCRCVDWCSIGRQTMSDRQRITEQLEFMPTAYIAGLIKKNTVSAECLMLGRCFCYCLWHSSSEEARPFLGKGERFDLGGSIKISQGWPTPTHFRFVSFDLVPSHRQCGIFLLVSSGYKLKNNKLEWVGPVCQMPLRFTGSACW